MPLELATAQIFAEVTSPRFPPAALATGVDTTDRNPAVRADAATSAMRCLIVFLDIFFLSLVELGNFPISAQRSC